MGLATRELVPTDMGLATRELVPTDMGQVILYCTTLREYRYAPTFDIKM
jgi:hypothetical protein